MDRLPLTDIISIDEVCLDLDPHCRYALVIQDFYTGNPIDLLSTRRTNDTEPYFMAIPLEERARVRYLISDMYNPYINWVNRYFPNAVSVVDSFHVIQWITHKIDNHIRALIKHFKARDREAYITNSCLKGSISLTEISLVNSRQQFFHHLSHRLKDGFTFTLHDEHLRL